LNDADLLGESCASRSPFSEVDGYAGGDSGACHERRSRLTQETVVASYAAHVVPFDGRESISGGVAAAGVGLVVAGAGSRRAPAIHRAVGRIELTV
jgi:hypothetical protein